MTRPAAAERWQSTLPGGDSWPSAVARRFGLAAVSWTSFALAAVLVGSLIWVVLCRCRHPFELEWMEGGMVDHVARVLEGRPIYVQPTIDFVPYIYNPFYYYVAAPFALVFGLDFFALRLVSLLAAAAACVLVFEIVRAETGRVRGGVLALGLFAGTYPLSDGWFDVARVDSLCLALCLGALLLVRRASSARGLVAAGVVAWLAFGTKQSVLPFLAALSVAAACCHGFKRSLWYSGSAWLLVGGSVTWGELSSHGWYSFYAFRLPLGHPMVDSLYVDFWKLDVLAALPVPVVLGVHYFVYRRTSSVTRTFYLVASLGLLAMAFASRVHSGSAANDSMPAHAALALVFGLGADSVMTSARGKSFGGVVAICQFAALLYDPARWIPTPADVIEGGRLIRYVGSRSGDVWLPHHTSLARCVRKRVFAQDMAIKDVLRSDADRKGARDGLNRSIGRALADRRFAAIVLDERVPFMQMLELGYRPAPAEFVDDLAALHPRSGWNVRPRMLYVPR